MDRPGLMFAWISKSLTHPACRQNKVSFFNIGGMPSLDHIFTGKTALFLTFWFLLVRLRYRYVSGTLDKYFKETEKSYRPKKPGGFPGYAKEMDTCLERKLFSSVVHWAYKRFFNKNTKCFS